MSRQFQQRVFRLFEVGQGDRLGRAVDAFIMSLIVANVLAVVLGTVDGVQTAYADALFYFELFSVAVFTVEYLARVALCTTQSAYAYHPVLGRLEFATRPYLLIDLLAILPFYVGFFIFDLRFLRALRLFRFFRLFKLTRYSASIRTFASVIRRKKEDLVVAITGTSILLLVSSSLMYFVEHGAQPEKFSSIPAALWWGVATLTTVGYGDVYPVTPLGKLLGALIAALGVGLFALPASILASGFIEDARRKVTRCPHCNERLDDEAL